MRRHSWWCLRCRPTRGRYPATRAMVLLMLIMIIIAMITITIRMHMITVMIIAIAVRIQSDEYVFGGHAHAQWSRAMEV